jgi:hypothetical protein
MGFVRARTTRYTGPSRDVVDMVVERDGYCCVRCGGRITGHRGFSWSLHHRRGRDGLHDSHQPQNLITLHGASNVHSCHGAVHSHRGQAMDAGYSLSRIAGADPLLYAVLLHGERFVYLTADGRYADDPVVAS